MPARPVPRAQHDQHHDDHDHSTFPQASQVAQDEAMAMRLAEAQTAVPSLAGDQDQHDGQDQPEPGQGQQAADGQEVAGDAVPATPDAPADGMQFVFPQARWYPRSHWLLGFPGVRDDQVSTLGTENRAPSSLASDFQLLYSIVEADGAGDDQNGQAPVFQGGDQGAGVGLQADEPGSASGQ